MPNAPRIGLMGPSLSAAGASAHNGLHHDDDRKNGAACGVHFEARNGAVERRLQPCSRMSVHISNTRLYAAAIAIVSGLYAVASVAYTLAETGMDGMARMGWGGPIMLAVGVLALIHGVVLLMPAARWLGRMGGPLMIAWGSLMLLTQWLLAMDTTMMRAMEPDRGMVAIATLMVISGAIMVARPMDVGNRP